MSKMRLLIAFGGKMGSGKDTAVSYMISEYGGLRHSFAKPLYAIQEYTQRRCGFTLQKDRQFLQYIGTEWARKKDPNVWVKIALREVPKTGNVFLSDLRFPNEFQALKKAGWICVKINRVHLLGREGSGDPRHSSEIALDEIPDKDWDLIIDNNEDLTSFYAKVDKIVSKIK